VALRRARCLKRVFGIEIEACARCGARLQIVASIEDPAVIARMLAHRDRVSDSSPGPGSTSVLRCSRIADRRELSMPTTTIRLDAEFKARIAAAAERAGTTPHAFILDTLARGIDDAEREAEFHEVADGRWAGVVGTGQTVAWEDAGAWLEARARGKRASRPPLDAHPSRKSTTRGSGR
jgi:predicted transcriptional regulator